MEILISDLKKTHILFLGFIVMAVGIVLIKRSDMGLFPWGVFHDGLSNVTPLSFGLITATLGFVILMFSVIVFKTNVGPGTFLNIFLVGPMIDLIDFLLKFDSEDLWVKIIIFTIGLVLMSLGKALYISTKLGAGPRDGLFVGISRTLQVDVKYVKPGIEIIVLLFGYLLGGTVGVGTVVTMFASGYLIQLFFSRLKFESKVDKQRSLLDYFKK